MSWIQASHRGSNQTNTSSTYHTQSAKPIEVYTFVDPLCPECWELEPYLHKLYLEYGRFFTFRRITCSYLNKKTARKHERLKKTIDTADQLVKNRQNHDDVWNQRSILFPWISVAIKAAELQGKKAGKRFLRKIQEYYFINHIDVTSEQVIIQAAKDIGLDIDEFRHDLYSSSIKKAIQRDMKIAKDMDVHSTPAVVFFNQTNESQGIKVSGLYSYDIYVSILNELLQIRPIPSVKPLLEDFIAAFEFVTKKEVSIVYDWTLCETKKQMKRLQLRRKVKKHSANHNIYYKLIR